METSAHIHHTIQSTLSRFIHARVLYHSLICHPDNPACSLLAFKDKQLSHTDINVCPYTNAHIDMYSNIQHDYRHVENLLHITRLITTR